MKRSMFVFLSLLVIAALSACAPKGTPHAVRCRASSHRDGECPDADRVNRRRHSDRHAASAHARANSHSRAANRNTPGADQGSS